VRTASPEAIAALPGFSMKSAQRILDILQQRSPTAPAAESAQPAESAVPEPTQ
jgi:hypothetical protein